MGLITGLLTLPLAPLRGTVKLAELIQEQAEKQMADEESALVASLAELESAREQGGVSEEEIEAAENELLERLIVLRGFGEQETHGVG